MPKRLLNMYFYLGGAINDSPSLPHSARANAVREE